MAFQISQRRACGLTKMNRVTYYYQSQSQDQAALRIRLRDLASVYVRYGYRRLHVLLRREGWLVNHKRVYRLYQEEGLRVRTKKRKKLATAPRGPRAVAERPRQHWSMDFVHDQLVDGRRFRCLMIVDHFSRVSPAIKVERSITGADVVELLQVLAPTAGLPEVLFLDNGTEFTSKAMEHWAYRQKIKLDYSRPGKPTDNAYIESFNGRLRDECLNLHWFESMNEALTLIEQWHRAYNGMRPHSSLVL